MKEPSVSEQHVTSSGSRKAETWIAPIAAATVIVAGTVASWFILRRNQSRVDGQTARRLAQRGATMEAPITSVRDDGTREATDAHPSS